ncbi:hypothetical protein [Nocardia speluncae]|uniref:hypothetical protein n=1 Tax=Nocardia speluncae TaxID=419477 RepID=UPI0008299E5D|nr:hypothetical protein [Nocardia speluncae]
MRAAAKKRDDRRRGGGHLAQRVHTARGGHRRQGDPGQEVPRDYTTGHGCRCTYLDEEVAGELSAGKASAAFE